MLLADYAQRLHDNAHDLPSQQDMVQYWSGIGFILDGVHYVAPIDEVAEVLSIPDYTRIPGVHPWMKGVSNVRGRLMAVMDLTVFLNKISRSEEHTSELQSLMRISYAVFCLKKKKNNTLITLLHN